MKKLGGKVIAVVFFVLIFTGSSLSTAMSDHNGAGGDSRADEAIGAVVKGIASTYIDMVDVETARSLAIHYLIKMDDKTFERYYSKIRCQELSDVPYQALGALGIPVSMSRQEAIEEVLTFSKARVKNIANSVPNSVAGACFRGFIRRRFHKDLSDEEMRQTAIGLARKIISKINGVL